MDHHDALHLNRIVNSFQRSIAVHPCPGRQLLAGQEGSLARIVSCLFRYKAWQLRWFVSDPLTVYQ